DGEYQYRIRNGGEIFEAGALCESDGLFTAGYQRALFCIKTLPPHEVLRNLRISNCAVLAPEELNPLYGSMHRNGLIIEVMEANHRFRVTRMSEDRGLLNSPTNALMANDREVEFQSGVIRRGSIYSLE